jgi:hypothetical protein
VGLKSLKSLNLTNGYPNKNKNNNKNNKNNKVKSKPLELRSRVKIIQKPKKKECDNEIFLETNKQITQSKLKPFSTNMLLRCCNSIRKINHIIIIVIVLVSLVVNNNVSGRAVSTHNCDWDKLLSNSSNPNMNTTEKSFSNLAASQFYYSRSNKSATKLLF